MKLKHSNCTECRSICYDDGSRKGLCIGSSLESRAASLWFGGGLLIQSDSSVALDLLTFLIVGINFMTH